MGMSFAEMHPELASKEALIKSGESGCRADLLPEQGAKAQEYFVYFTQPMRSGLRTGRLPIKPGKLLERRAGENMPTAAEGGFNQRFPKFSERNLPLTASDITYGSNKKYWWFGKCGHEWLSSPKIRHSGEGCPYCAGMRVLEGFNDLASVKPELVDEWSSENEPLKPNLVSNVVLCTNNLRT